MNDQEPLSEFEVREVRKWRRRWNDLRYLALAVRKLTLWVAAAGVALSTWWDIIQSLTGAGTRK